ncbi:hypothetical protein [Yoonia algicola]|uniref:Uncharacterized protein n=1 Tax=Yoonia algicola TaxID=3137368 RepID=A0AAN0M4T0_9RHOB
MTNPFYELATILGAVSKAEQKQSLSSTLSEAAGLGAMETRFYILRLMDDAIEVFAHSKVPEHRISTMIEQVNQFKHSYISCSDLASCGEFASRFQLQARILYLNSFGDTVEASSKVQNSPVDRGELQTSTLALMGEIRQSDLPEYAKDVLLLKMSALQKILVECDFYTDNEIRRRVKIIYADFCGEFRNHDKKHEKVEEMLLRWAKGAAGVGVFALALTADVTEIAGLLAPPST